MNCSEFGDYFGVAVAGFPEGHPSSSRESVDMEIIHLKVSRYAMLW
jgi:5,10-methylenetetrahydrofolate reductase